MTASADRRISVVVATYEWPEALDVVLAALSEQSAAPFEVVIADDGSGPKTAAVAGSYRTGLRGSPQHVRQPNRGYRKSRALNLAALETRGDYLVFIDGDCVPRRGFLEALGRAALPGWFVASKRLHVSQDLSRRVVENRLPVWRWSAARWLVRHPRELLTAPRQTNRPGVLFAVRDRRRPWRPEQPDFSPPYEGYGFCLGVSRADFERVNGFDMRFVGWGGEDRDLAVRLRRFGLRCGWPGPQATLLHLWHETPVRRTRPNAALLRETQRSARSSAVVGLDELAAQVSA